MPSVLEPIKKPVVRNNPQVRQGFSRESKIKVGIMFTRRNNFTELVGDSDTGVCAGLYHVARVGTSPADESFR